jgi:hypothetical protein
MILVLTPKKGRKTEVGATIAELEIKTVSPECSRAFVEDLLFNKASGFVNKFSNYNLTVRP